VADLLSIALVIGGAFFYFAGTVGLLRFPDVYTRLHALTKADNLGLGLITLGLMLRADAGGVARLAATWVLVLAASAAVCHAVARAALDHRIEPWKRP
jgi:multicomponent Na+:H+ antiporter subunit G